MLKLIRAALKSPADEIDVTRQTIARLESEQETALRAATAAASAVGESLLHSENGEADAASLKMLAKTRGHAEAIGHALTAARDRLTVLLEEQARQASAAAWDTAERLAADVAAAGKELDDALAVAGDRWFTLQSVASKLQQATPIAIPMLTAGEVSASFQLALDRFNLPTESRWRRNYGDLKLPPSAEESMAKTLAYLRRIRSERSAA